MTEEQNKLADELDAEVKNERSGKIANLMMRASAALREREPATEAVRDALVKAADTFRDLVGVLQLLNRPVSARACEIAEEGCRAALKGKGASQGADAQFDMMAELKSRLAAPEPSGEMSDQHRILLGAAISISNALHNEEMRGAKLKASTDTAWEKLSLAIEHSSAILAPMSRRDEDG